MNDLLSIPVGLPAGLDVGGAEEATPAITPSASGGAPSGGAGGGGVSFSSELGSALDAVDKLQGQADQQAQAVARGGGNLHEMTLALQEADIAMRVAIKARNKLVDAYQEIMKMSV